MTLRAPTSGFADSVCWGCVSHRPVAGRNTTFVLCTALAEKYPRQPVHACQAFRPMLPATTTPPPATTPPLATTRPPATSVRATEEPVED